MHKIHEHFIHTQSLGNVHALHTLHTLLSLKGCGFAEISHLQFY